MDLTNAIQEEIENRAEDEARSAHPRFVDWLEEQPSVQLGIIIAAAFKRNARGEEGLHARDQLAGSLDQLMLDYKQARIASSYRNGEWGEVEADILDAARDYADEQREAARWE